MGKLLNGLILLFIIDLAMVLFLGISTPTTSIFAFMTGGIGWNNLAFLDQIRTILALAGTAGILVGTILNSPDPSYIAAPFAALILSYGITFYELYGTLIAYGWFGGNQYIILMPIAFMTLFFVYTVVKFWRGND